MAGLPVVAAVIDTVCGGEASDVELLVADASRRKNLEQLCEAYYYAGEVCLLADATGRGRGYFAQCVDTGLLYDPNTEIATPMNEFELARWRLETRFEGRSE